MKREQVFVRAIDKNEKWAAVDALDLDDESFRAFILEKLHQAGLIYGTMPDEKGEEIVLREKKDGV
jgi:hypothetical protein